MSESWIGVMGKQRDRTREEGKCTGSQERNERKSGSNIYGSANLSMPSSGNGWYDPKGEACQSLK